MDFKFHNFVGGNRTIAIFAGCVVEFRSEIKLELHAFRFGVDCNCLMTAPKWERWAGLGMLYAMHAHKAQWNVWLQAKKEFGSVCVRRAKEITTFDIDLQTISSFWNHQDERTGTPFPCNRRSFDKLQWKCIRKSILFQYYCSTISHLNDCIVCVPHHNSVVVRFIFTRPVFLDGWMVDAIPRNSIWKNVCSSVGEVCFQDEHFVHTFKFGSAARCLFVCRWIRQSNKNEHVEREREREYNVWTDGSDREMRAKRSRLLYLSRKLKLMIPKTSWNAIWFLWIL